MRKSRILTFLFGLFPGAGQMYLGYMRRGVSLMFTFFLIFALMGLLGLSFLAFLLPVIWFYAFFDTLNLRSMTYEMLPQDSYIFPLDSLSGRQVVDFFRTRHLLGGILLILLGVYILLHTFLLPFFYYTLNINLYPLFESLPTLAISAVIILLGVHMIRSAVPKAIDSDYDSYQEYHSEDEGNTSSSGS